MGGGRFNGRVATALALAGVGAYWGIRFASSSFVRPLLGSFLLWRVPTDRPAVALTFDDGPDPRYTEAFLAALEGAQATFFVLGESVERWPYLARAIVEAGHEIAVHGYSHRTMTRTLPLATLRDLRKARRAIIEATGVTPGFYRPAYGRFNLVSWIEASRLGLRRTLWTAGARDWESQSTPGQITQRILSAAEPGAIFLLHDADGDPGAPRNTLAAIPGILTGLSERALRTVTLSDLVEGWDAEPVTNHPGPSAAH